MATPQPITTAWPIDLSQDPLLRNSFDLLRRKWGEVPYTQFDRIKPKELLTFSDREILETWTRAYLTNSTGAAFSVRGWYQALYKDTFRGKKILDVGCGLGPDSVFFAEHGATVTFMDIVETNIEFVKRVCTIKGLKNVDFCYLEDLSSLSVLSSDYDVLYCCGSFINAPLELARMEAQALLEHLPIGGRWIELGYPKSRWEREGRMAFNEWGKITDGGAPWIEWHDLAKLRHMLAPARFDVILDLEFHNHDFIWFDLLRVAGNFEPDSSNGKDPNLRDKVSEPVSLQPASGAENHTAGQIACGGMTPALPLADTNVNANAHDREVGQDLFDRSRKARRPAITEGFVMPGFTGFYWMWPEEYALLAKYVDLTQGNYLEIGSMCGIVAMSFAEKYSSRHFVCVDAFTAGLGTIAGEKETFLQNLREHNLKNVSLIEGDSLKVVPPLTRKFDVVFIDGNHAYEYVLGDALNSWRLLEPGGFIVFHDYECVEETTRAVHEFLDQTGAQLVELVSSLAVACKPDQIAQGRTREIQDDLAESKARLEQVQHQVTTLQYAVETRERELACVRREKHELDVVWEAVQNSAGWRMLNSWRKARERLLPPGSSRRNLYESLLSRLRK